MYEVQIINRGPEGIRAHKQFRLTEAGGNELQRRIEAGEPMGDLLIKLEQVPVDQPAAEQPANGKKSKAAK